MNKVKMVKLQHRKQVNSFQEHATEQKDSVKHQLEGCGLGKVCTGACKLKWNVPKWNNLEFKTLD